MSYRLINSNEIAIKYPEVNEMDCIYVDLPNGLDNEYHYIDAEPTKHGRWIERGDNSWECSVCHEISCCNGNYCVDCGARKNEVEDGNTD